jgi:hypothetical protein
MGFGCFAYLAFSLMIVLLLLHGGLEVDIVILFYLRYIYPSHVFLFGVSKKGNLIIDWYWMCSDEY